MCTNLFNGVDKGRMRGRGRRGGEGEGGESEREGVREGSVGRHRGVGRRERGGGGGVSGRESERVVWEGGVGRRGGGMSGEGPLM